MDNQMKQQNPSAQQTPPAQYVPYQPYIPKYTPYVKKVYPPLDKRDSRFVFIFLLCAVIFTDFALFKGFHLGFTLAYALIFGISTVYLWQNDKKPTAFPLLCGIISLVGAVSLSLFTNVFVNVIMLVLIAGLFTVYCMGISGAYQRSFGNFKMLFELATGALLQPLENLGDVAGSVKAGAKKGSRNFSALIGVLLALPVLLVIVPLLVSSDAAFEGLIKSAGKNTGIYLLELAVALLLTPFAYSYMFGKKHRLNQKTQATQKGVKRRFPASGSAAFLSVISLVYVVYLFSQLAYFFSAFKGLLPEGYTHNASVFARRGFFEMFAVVAINIVLISAVSAFTKRSKGKASAGVKGVSLFISLFSLLMLAVSMQKMRLNIATYGYSRNRLLVCAFMLMMLVVLAFFILHIFVPKIPYMQAIIVICSVIFVALSFSDINALTANYNVGAYQSGKLSSVNVEYLADLGDSVTPALIKLTKSDNPKTAARAEIALIKYAADSENILLSKNGTLKAVPTDFRSYSKAKEDAAKAVCAYINAFDESQKQEVIKKYNFFNNHHDVEYDEEEEYYYCYTNDSAYRYSKNTHRFEYVTRVNEE